MCRPLWPVFSHSPAKDALLVNGHPQVIYTIDRLGDALYCGTSNGIYIVRDDILTQLRFEPDAEGRLIMIPREVR